MLKLKKSLGQNFLSDNNIIKKIIGLDNLKNRNIIEIGPGSGNLTEFIIKEKPKKLVLIEKDRRFYKLLKDKFVDHKFIEIHNKEAFEVYCYDFGNHEDDEYTNKIRNNHNFEILYQY